MFELLIRRSAQFSKLGSPLSFSVLHTFTTIGNDGAYPAGGLVQDSSGGLFGTTSHRGFNGMGTVYKIALGQLVDNVLHNFSASGGDAQYPRGKLAQDSRGVIYGTTSIGGSNGCGTLFEIHPNGSNYSILRTYAHIHSPGVKRV